MSYRFILFSFMSGFGSFGRFPIAANDNKFLLAPLESENDYDN